MRLDPERLAAPVTDDEPCGPDLRADAAFGEIEDAATRLAEYKAAEHQALIGKCAALLERSKDQMPALVAAQAAARLGDPEGIDLALRVLIAMIADHWDLYHPGPASEMQVARASEFAVLSRPAALVLPLGRMALARMPGAGGAELNAAVIDAACRPVPEWSDEDDKRLSARAASGQISALGARDMRRVHDGARALRGLMRVIAPSAVAADADAGVSYDAPEDPLRVSEGAAQVLAAVREARGLLAALSDTMFTLTDAYAARAGEAPGLAQAQSQVGTMLSVIDRFVDTFAPQASTAENVEATTGPVVKVTSVTATTTARAPGEIARREDVIDALDRICHYYAAAEPGSPIPLALKRVRGWVSLDFIALMNDLAPNGIDELKRVLIAREI